MTDPRGKPCPHCGSPLSDLRSINHRQCSGCARYYKWELSEGQKPLVGSNRQDRGSRK